MANVHAKFFIHYKKINDLLQKKLFITKKTASHYKKTASSFKKKQRFHYKKNKDNPEVLLCFFDG